MEPLAPTETKTLCVYCASSSAVESVFFEAAAELGRLMAQNGYGLVYGGTNIGLMGAVAEAVFANGGRVVGVIPEPIQARGIANPDADELIVTRDLRERKAHMEALADAFLCLPGGFGTLEELLEVLTLKQLHLHTKPIVLLNIQGFFDPLLALFDHLFALQFARPENRDLYQVVSTPAEVFPYLASYRPEAIPAKWL